jgi:hypothetical protein
MVGQRGIMAAYRKTGMVIDRTATLTNEGVDVFAFSSGPFFSRLTEAQGFTSSLSRTITVSQNFSTFQFLDRTNPPLLGPHCFLIP